MYYKKTLIFLIFTVLGIPGKQIFSVNKINSDIRSFHSNTSEKNDSNLYSEYIIPVKFRIIRKDSTDKSIGPKYLKELIQFLNYYYSINETGISFYIHPETEYIEKEKLLNLNYYSQAPFQASRKHSKYCINVIITENLIKNKFLKSQKKKYAGTYNPFFKTVIISRNTSTSTLSHEIGHYLGLKHPHRGWKYKWFQEPVSRSKTIPGTNVLLCKCRGDKLCDTPAEPNLTKYTDKNCNYTGWNVKDKFGEVYKPNTHNIMSYTNNRECRNKFTREQILLMHRTLSKNKFSKFWKAENIENKKYFPDAFEPDNYKETATEIFFNTPQIHSFHFVYTGKRKNIQLDNTDLLFFELNTLKPQTLNVTISGINNTSSKIQIQIFNSTSLVLEKILSLKKNPQQIHLLKTYPGKYIIKIKQIVNNKQETFYKIIINK